MFGERQARALLAPADPARHAPVPPPVVGAHDLILRAEQRPDDPRRRAPRVGRRLVLGSAGAVVVAATVVAAVRHDRGEPETWPAARGVVVTPVAFHGPADTPSAGRLRELADRIGDAGWDTMTGPYTYHHVLEWGTFGVGAENGRYHKAAVDEHFSWYAADGTGRWVWKHRPPQYRDEASRAYFEARHDILDATPDTEGVSSASGRAVLPSGPAALAVALDLANPTAVPDRLTRLYVEYAIPRATRADLLRILAGLPGYAWRGPVVDRAGRSGVALTYRPPGRRAYEELLVLDPATGALLAHEKTPTVNGRTFVAQYTLILDTRLTSSTR